MKKFRFSKAIFPNSFTAANLLCGFLAIILTDQNDYRFAASSILLGAVFDALDGLVARLVGTSSQFGVELDSLADVVTFGVAPGFLIYHTYLHTMDIWGMIIASLLPIFGAFRLARFNVQVEDLNTKIDFRGLPIPTTAILISSMILAYYTDAGFNESFKVFIIPTIIILSLLMVSDVRYDSIGSVRKKSGRISIIYFIIFIGFILLGTFTINELLLFTFYAFVIYGLVRQVLYFTFPSKFKAQE